MTDLKFLRYETHTVLTGTQIVNHFECGCVDDHVNQYDGFIWPYTFTFCQYHRTMHGLAVPS